MGAFRPAASLLAGAAVTGTRDAQTSAVTRSRRAPANLKILHVLRAPLGGLFRHVLDITHGQIERGHSVGLVVDSTTGGERADAVLGELAPRLTLGLMRVVIARELGLADLAALRVIAGRLSQLRPDVLHGHGAKGAALARLCPCASNAVRVYTPHGGSLVYRPGTLRGRFYRSLEWLLRWRTDLFLFESRYIADVFRSEVGDPHGLVRIVPNGVGAAEFAPIAPQPEATDIVCVGELRPVKAIDMLIEALAVLNRGGRRVNATIAGDGPDRAALETLAQRLGVAAQVRFVGYRPAREAFAMGRMLVVPSRAESLPYIVLEAAAAAMPIIATRVGGIPEIFGSQSPRLIAPDDTAGLVAAIAGALDNPREIERGAQAVEARVRCEFSIEAMVDGGLAAYREALALKHVPMEPAPSA
jgi:glycosyltransferase involved in cell wall biosynthesis